MIDPVIISFWNISITWYAVSYLLGFFIGLHIIKKLSKKWYMFRTTILDLDIVFNYIIYGTIIGGRLGHVLFFDSAYYFYNPLEIFKIWNGGMSFHGGVLGILISLNLVCKIRNLEFWKMADMIALASPIGLFLGRCANFINQELYGIPTDSCFGIVFPKVDSIARHPTQLYEAVLEGALMFVLLRILLKHSVKYSRYFYGYISAMFAILYSVFRFLIEFIKKPDTELFNELNLFFTPSIGQILCLILFIFGIVVYLRNRRSI